MLVAFAGALTVGLVRRAAFLPGPRRSRAQPLLGRGHTDTNNIATLPWRAVFADAPLQKLFEEGLNQNLGLHIADTRIQRAQANLAQSRA